jgi:cystathionine gamma-synthase
MSVFNHIPLGQRIPASLHGVSCSLPTMRDVIGYETKAPETMQHLCSGYPRFVQHPYLRQAAAHIVNQLGLHGHLAWLTASQAAAHGLQAWLKPVETRLIDHDGLSGVAFLENAETFASAKTFLQHTGSLLSSREAEDYLLRVGEIASPQPETSFEGYAPGRVKSAVATAFGHVTSDDVFLACSGMNAIFATFRIASALQLPRKRTVWVQLGWLYLDTIALLQKFTQLPARDYVFLSDVFDLAALRRLFAERGHEIAGVITETPTNPLIQTPDLAAVHELCRAHGALFIVDPTIASPLNIDVLPYCDVAVNSLTKYAASDGDVIMGAVVVNPKSPDAAEFRRQLPARLEPVYTRDVGRLAAQIGDYAKVITRVNQTAPAVVEFLRQHPRVKNLRWSNHPDSRENFLRLARRTDAFASMISFNVDGPLANFYDRLRLPKGASFGMKNTLVCPFIYLAHYDLVTSDNGRDTLHSSGLNPELVRLSIGCEPVEEIIAALAEALS